MAISAHIQGLAVCKRRYEGAPCGGGVTILTDIGGLRVRDRFGARLPGSVVATADGTIIKVGHRRMFKGG